MPWAKGMAWTKTQKRGLEGLSQEEQWSKPHWSTPVMESWETAGSAHQARSWQPQTPGSAFHRHGASPELRLGLNDQL